MLAAAEQESLLLRQVVALRQSGLSHEQALTHAAAGLPSGPLAVRVASARRALTAGVPSPADPLLSTGTTPVDALEHAAAALDARLSADAALSTARVYATAAVAGPLVIGCGLAWAIPELLSIVGESPPPMWSGLVGLLSLLQYAGLPLAVGAAVLISRGSGALAPGVARIRHAALLLDAASTGRALPEITDPAALAYFDIRRQQVGEARAASELAEQLRLSGERLALLYRHLAPPLAAILAVVVLTPLVMVLILPLFSMVS